MIVDPVNDVYKPASTIGYHTACPGVGFSLLLGSQQKSVIAQAHVCELRKPVSGLDL